MRKEKEHPPCCHGEKTPPENQAGHPQEKLGLSLFSAIIFPMTEQLYLSVQEMVSFNLSATPVPVFQDR